MTRTTSEIEAGLDALTANDFDLSCEEANGMERLYAICEELRGVPDSEAVMHMLFLTMDRLSKSDIGSPGPIVHLLESWPGSYEASLRQSLARKPTSLTVWMANRIINIAPPDKEMWLEALRDALNHPLISNSA